MRDQAVLGVLLLLAVWTGGFAGATGSADRQVVERVSFQDEIPAAAKQGSRLLQAGSPGGTIDAPSEADRVELDARWRSSTSTVEAVRLEACSPRCPDAHGDVTAVSDDEHRMRIQMPVEGGSVEWLAYLHEGEGARITVTGDAVFLAEGSSPREPERALASTPQASDASGDLERGEAVLAAAAGAAVAVVYLLGDRFRWLLVGLYHRIRREDLFDNETRRRIREALRERPGLHFRKLARRLDVAHDPLNHHLRILRDRQLVVEEQIQGRRCLFWTGQIDPRCRRALGLAASSGARSLLEVLRGSPGLDTTQLGEEAGLAPSTVSYHLERLQKAGVVERERDGRHVRARLTEVGRRALDLLDPDPG